MTIVSWRVSTLLTTPSGRARTLTLSTGHSERSLRVGILLLWACCAGWGPTCFCRTVLLLSCYFCILLCSEPSQHAGERWMLLEERVVGIGADGRAWATRFARESSRLRCGSWLTSCRESHSFAGFHGTGPLGSRTPPAFIVLMLACHLTRLYWSVGILCSMLLLSWDS